MRVADFIFDFLAKKGVNTCFLVTGGQAMFLNDALFQNKNFQSICTHHEQSAGMAADAYGRLTGKLGLALVTAGPGSMNVINGLAGGWTDSSPMMVVSGQAPLSFVQYQEKTKIRQYGIQGILIKPFVERATKFFVTVDDPAKILYYMQKAYYLATTGRPGPVWVDVPLDVQRMEVPNKVLEEFIPPPETTNMELMQEEIVKVLDIITTSKRPILLVGHGVRIANAIEELMVTLKQLNIPVLTSRLGIDIIASDNRLYVGRPGTYGERAANFAIQNADAMITVGCRLATALVGHDLKNFAKTARKVIVDIDTEELYKPGFDDALKIQCDAKVFLQNLNRASAKLTTKPDFNAWVDKCNHWKTTYPVVLPAYVDEKPVNSYYFTDKLSQAATQDDMILVDTGSCFHVACQTWKIKQNQRFLTTGGLSSMGYWVAAIGACLANDRRRTIVITGDGSLQMNLQELATIKHNNLPIKVIIFNNNGYLLIRHTQKNFMEGRLFGEGPTSGVWCPDSMKIAAAYGIKAVRIESVAEVDAKLKEVMDDDGPVICDVMTPEWQLLIPRVSSEKLADGTLVSRPYEDMFPFLDRDEIAREMVNQKDLNSQKG